MRDSQPLACVFSCPGTPGQAELGDGHSHARLNIPSFLPALAELIVCVCVCARVTPRFEFTREVCVCAHV